MTDVFIRIVAADGFGMAASWICGFVKHTFPKVARAFPSLFKNMQSLGSSNRSKTLKPFCGGDFYM
jgi:hypothetical protein